MQRRGFLAGLGAGVLCPAQSWADAGSPAFLAAAKEPDGAFALHGISEGGQTLFQVALPARGHAGAAHPFRPEAVAFARRPGTFALVIDCVSGRVLARLEAPEGQHFYGHGAFLEGGRLLVTSENHVESGQGRLGLWDAEAGYLRLGALPSHGIGPHEILALSDTELAVANGGIRTHPDQGRAKLNLPSMQPNLSYVDLHKGLQEQVVLDASLHQNSIRHLAAQGGLVGFAMQWQGDLSEVPPLLGLHRRGEAVQLCAAPFAEQYAMQGYAGSIAIADGMVGLTSPRGGRLHLFGADGSFRQSLRRADVCGLAPAPKGFLASDGTGGLLAVTRGESGYSFAPKGLSRRAWDNHLVAL